MCDEKKKSNFPWKMTVWSIILIAGFIVPKVFIAEIEEATGQGLDLAGIGGMACLLFLFLSWFLYITFFTGWRWWRRVFVASLVASVPIAFLLLFEPIGGDLNAWRFKGARTVLPIEVAAPSAGSAAVDLSVETSDDFAGYLGPNRSGVINGIEIDVSRFAQSKILWKKPIGEGWSAFSARNGFAVTMEQRGDKECVTCYEIATGDLQWIYTHEARHDDIMGKVGPRSTPTIHDGKVYACGSLGNFVCLDGATGDVIWQKSIHQILGIEVEEVTGRAGDPAFREKHYRLAWGRSASPLIVDDMVVISGGGPVIEKDVGGKKQLVDGEMHTLLAFNKNSGEVVWKAGDQMIGYASPSLMELAGRRQIVITAEATIMGFDPTSGETLWTWPRPGQASGMANTSQLRRVSDTQLLSTKGYPDGGGQLVKFTTADDGRITPESVWQEGRVLKTKLSSAYLYDGHAYALTNGFLECTRVADGKRQWKQRGRFGHGQMLVVGDKLLLHSEGANRTAKLYLVEASPDSYQELGSFETIDGVCWNTLCLHGSKLLVRSEQEAACIELPIVRSKP